jgi:hypothetical protein
MERRSDREEGTLLLLELLLQADLFCNRVEALGRKQLSRPDMDALSLKISQCRGILAHLQQLYDDDKLAVTDPETCADFRNLVMSLLWVNFLAREVIDRRMFRKLVQIESTFTYVLVTRPKQKR